MSSPFIIINEIEELLNDMNDGLTSTLSTINTNVNTIKTNVGAVKSATAVNNTASKTGVLSAKSAYIISLLENSTYGLSAIKNAITSNSGMKLKSVTKTWTSSGAYDIGIDLYKLYCFRIDKYTKNSDTVTCNYYYFLGAGDADSATIGYNCRSSNINLTGLYLVMAGSSETGKFKIATNYTGGAVVTFYYFE